MCLNKYLRVNFKCQLLLIFYILISYESDFVLGDDIIETRCRVLKGITNKTYEQTIKRDEAVMYQFFVDRRYLQDPSNTNLRIEAEVDQKTTLQDPILFAVGQRKSINTFDLPQTFSQTTESGKQRVQAPVYFNAGRNLCLQKLDNVFEGQNITVGVSTSSKTRVAFRLRLLLSQDFQIPIDREVSVTVSPTSPKYFGFQFSRPDVSLVRIKAYSETDECLTISVQTPRCPIFDKENNIRYQGLWQTMTTQSAMTIERKNRFENGFVLVLVAHDNDERCSKSSSSSYLLPRPNTDAPKMNSSFGSGSNNFQFGSKYPESPRSKTIKIIVSNESDVSGWIMFLCMFIPVISTFLLLTIVTLLFRNRHRWMRVEAEQKLTAVNCGLLTSVKSDPRATSNNQGGSTIPVPNEDLDLEDLGVFSSDEEENGTVRLERFNDTAAESSKKHKGQSNSESRCRWKADLRVADFKQKDPSLAKSSGKNFYWTIIIVAIFYSIPVYQLILHYLRVLFKTGEYDICFYNYLCANRLGLFVDFNHFWSNVSYIIFGFAFVYFVNRRSNSLVEVSKGQNFEEDDGMLHKCCGYSKIPTRSDFGIPQNWGIFYALGIALAMEGVLSAAYHLCPNQSTFQFDTCFMYIIAVLIILKIYQFRHAVHLGANRTFAILAAFVLISVVGLMFEFQESTAKKIYRWSFVSLQFVSMSLMSLYFYSVGYVRNNDTRSMITDWKIFANLNQLKTSRIHGDRLIQPAISFILGICVLIYCELGHEDFATYLLYTLVANVIGSTLYYVGIMKPLHGEFKNRTWVQPAIYFVGAGVIGGFAMRYFTNSPAEWNLSAAASRATNQECMKGWFPFQPFYDSHDVWHFLSAAALFLSFMALLIVDDDLLTIPQRNIAVF